MSGDVPKRMRGFNPEQMRVLGEVVSRERKASVFRTYLWKLAVPEPSNLLVRELESLLRRSSARLVRFGMLDFHVRNISRLRHGEI